MAASGREQGKGMGVCDGGGAGIACHALIGRMGAAGRENCICKPARTRQSPGWDFQVASVNANAASAGREESTITGESYYYNGV